MAEIYDFYYSNIAVMNLSDFTPNTVEINGDTFLYTECITKGKKPFSKWDDLRFVGSATLDKIKVR